jgi:hypothetical protein
MIISGSCAHRSPAVLHTTPTGADAVLNRVIPRLCSRMLYKLRVRMQRARVCIRVGCRVIYQIIRLRKHTTKKACKFSGYLVCPVTLRY